MGQGYEKLQRCCESCRNRIPFAPKLALILGSGLGDYAENFPIEGEIPYQEIEGFPVSTVPGHRGRFVFAHIGQVPVVMMQGRVHYYEGYPMDDVVLPIRLMRKMGAEVLFLTNAAGGVNYEFQAGDFMMITDQISSFVPSPLIGPNSEELGPRFPAMTNAYSPRLIRLAQDCARQFGITLRQGVYVGLQGPSFETPAEYNWLRIIGGDAVGMSTIPEILVARHMGMECFGISVITNSTAKPEHIQTSHAEVQDVGNAAQPRLSALLKEIISQL